MSNFYNDKETYDIPSVSNYMRLEDGDNRFRILGAFSEGSAIQGQLFWKTIEGKRSPVRQAKKEDGTFPNVPIAELETNKFGDLDMPKYFWALPVYNYAEKKVQILEITQKTILKGIQAYIANPKWGDPRDYDIIVNRGKEGDKTVYTVTVDPKEKIDTGVIDQFIAMDIQIHALFDGEDPFAGTKGPEDIA